MDREIPRQFLLLIVRIRKNLPRLYQQSVFIYGGGKSGFDSGDTVFEITIIATIEII
jgi:hypothetical protein